MREYIVHIPAHNPSAFTLCGTNCYILGRGKHRILVEAGDWNDNEVFLQNLGDFVAQEQIQFTHLLLTHGHHDHFGGLRDVLALLKPNIPNCYKMLTNNIAEQQVFAKHPELRPLVNTIQDG